MIRDIQPLDSRCIGKGFHEAVANGKLMWGWIVVDVVEAPQGVLVQADLHVTGHIRCTEAAAAAVGPNQT